MAVGVGSFAANIARIAQLRSRGRIADVTVLINCPDGERFTGTITVTQGLVTASHPLSGACTGGLSEYPLSVPPRGPDRFAPGEALADIEIVVHSRGEVTDEQQWTRRILLAGPDS